LFDYERLDAGKTNGRPQLPFRTRPDEKSRADQPVPGRVGDVRLLGATPTEGAEEITVSDDGKTLTMTVHVPGRSEPDVLVFEKE
jgi:hypothetical protein